MSEMNGSRERITLLDRPVPSLIGRLTPSTERVLASDEEAARAARQLDTLLGRLVLAQLCAMGLFATARGSIRRWTQQVALSPLYGRWLEETLRILAHRGEIEVEGDLCAVREATGGANHDTVPWFDWDDFRRTWSRDRDLRAPLNLADATLRALPAILSGREQATHVLFPDASMVLVESVYKHNAVADHFNAVLADTVVAYVRERLARDAGARLRILEIGAGTGGTTEGLLARLEPQAGAIAEYCYTDVSHAFLLHGEQVYGPKARYLTCKRFNVEESPQAQGLAIGAYDVVIAANVLHATKQIRRTLRHVKATLRRNGILVLNEISAPGMFTHLTFGLLEGWWLYEDAALRIPGAPALSGETWRRVLEGEGFSSVVFPAEATHDRGHQIIVAESDGLVRHAPTQPTQPTQTTQTPQPERVIAPDPASERPRGPVVVDARRDERARAVERGDLDGMAGAARGHDPRGIDVLRERATVALRKLLADTIRTPLHRIDEAQALEKYGVDSLLMVKLTRGLRGVFPGLSSTLFFEHRTLAGVADFLIETEEAAVRAWVGLEHRPVHRMNGHAPAVAAAPAREPVSTPAPAEQDSIAIIGLSGRYPGARDVREYWDNLKAGRSSIREIPAERWDHRRYYDPQKGKPGKSYSKWGGFLEDIDAFDPLFFRISPKEAEQMDPQERLFLQEAYASIEDAGYTPAGLCASRKVGVYVGVMNSTYQRHAAYWSIANRVSYLFDFHGPSMAVDTACSSSLTAIHLAVEAIQHGACEMAIAGGVHLIVDPVQYANLSAATMLSTGDRCKAFGARADGFVDGEGVGSIVLKSLGHAIADGDHIYGVIRGSAVNAGGKTHGYTVPNPAAQRDVVQAALRTANVDPRAVSYVEAHGTGTELGDPIEIAGLTQAFAAQTGERQYCAIGSVKSNIGHLESAAGIAAVTKVLLQLQARTLVPSLHAEELNPHIDFPRTPFRVQQAVSEWSRPVVRLSGDGEAREYPRIAGVSSFGAGGGNAHVVIEEHGAAARPAAAPARHPAMIVLSARSEAQLVEQAQRLLAHVTRGEHAGELTDIAYTLQVGREAMDHRLAFTAASLAELHDKLGAFVAGRALDDGHRGEARTSHDVLGALLEDGDLAEAIDRWIRRGTYGKLLGLWVRGAAVDWARLYRDGAPLADVVPRRVSLPSYAFARERCWLDRSAVLDAAAESVAPPTSEDAASAASAASAPSTASASNVSDGLRGCISLVPRWEPVTPRSIGSWPEAGARVLWVNPAPAPHEEPASPPLVLAVDDDPAIETIAARIRSLGEVDHVVWRAPASGDAESIEAQTAGVIGLYRLIKALLSLGYGPRALGLTVLTQEAHAVRPEDRVCAAHASVHGLIGSLAKEQPRWKVRLVDLGRESDAEAPVWRSLPPDPRGRAWAHRDGVWHEQQLVPLVGPSVGPPAYRQHGVYVVIGGAGHIGMAWSEWVIARYQAQVIWLGRRPQDAAIAARIARLAGLGRAPHYLVADAADLDSLQKACREIRQAHGRIDGVVLSSAVLEPRAIQDLPEDQLRASLRAKVDVSVRVAQVFADEPLDFVLFFSSLIAFIKNPLQGHYAAGCSFADAFARRWAQRASSVKVINWGYWDKAGLSGLAEVEQLTRAGLGRIEAPEGMAALDALLSGPLAQLGLIKLTRPLAIEGVNADESIRVLGEGAPEDRPVDAARLEARMQAALAGRHADIARRVAAQAARTDQRERLEDLLATLLVVQLGKLGLFQAASTSLEAEQRRLDARYGRWLEETVRALGRQGYLRADRAGLSVTRWPDEQAAWQAWEAARPALAADADLRAGIELLGSTLPALPDILSGKRPATDVLFQGAAMTQVEGMYRGNPRADYFNAVVAEAVVAYLEDRRASASPPGPIRILEIGAGTGGTSVAVFERLHADRDLVAEYCYTDLSTAFLRHAESQYGARHPYLICKRFDVERPPGEQGIAVGAYDLVIATNVLHATRRIRHTVRNAKAALRRGGVLLLNEMNSHSRGLLIHLTFGLTTGWWLFEDEALRIPGTPGVSPETWRSVLASEGFSGIGFPARAGHELGQQVVLAQSDGVVQQRVTRTAAAASAPRAVPVSAAPPATSSGVGPAGAVAGGLAERVREAVLDVLCSALKLPRGKVDEAASFADYGMDSIVGVGFVEALNRRLALDLETTVIFDYSSVARLSELIVSRHREALAASAPESAPAKLDPPAPPPTVAGPEVVSAPAAAERPARPPGKEPIAIVGIAGRFAQSSTPEELWQHLANGDDLVGAVERWDLRALYAERGLPEGCRSGSFLERLDEFDPLFFHISGMEATFMDPQQRIFLEEAWKALEDAGYAGSALSGRSCGVYVGCMTGDYAEHCKHQAPAQAMWGNAASIIPARISYHLNLQGPAIAIDSACSSSLVAMHLACQALWAHEIELALAGGVSVQTTPGFYLQASNAGMLSSTGRCHTFDDRADGFVPGEGAGVVVLKRLSDALAAGDHIHAVIRGSGINQDGTTNGITAPSALSQERVERDVYASFGIHPEDIQLVEAHGTGTRLGDPIEFRALRSSFGASTQKTAYCALGSIKTNIGHTLLAAGVAGVLKLVMALKHRQLPPSLHFERGNSQIDFETSPFFVNTTLRPWEVPAGQKRRAAVSSFGFSGTNAHMVIEEAPDAARAPAIRPGHLVVLSARTASQLKEQVTRLVRHCEDHREIHCGDISYTLLLGRRHLAHRLACVARDVEGLVTALRTWLDAGKAAQVFAAVVDDDSHEQAPLVQYGNQCIEACRAALADAQHLEHLAMLASLYTQGYRLRYDRLFAGAPYARISLPTYPFARDRYWPDDAHRAAAAGATARPDALHPLLHRNTSTLAEQRFTTRLGTRAAGDEFVLDQHIVQGNKILPGVAYLEMARAAVAASVDAGLQGSVVLEDIVWLRPVIGSGDTEVHIRLRSAAEDAARRPSIVDFEIYSGADADAAAGLHAQGRAMVVDTGPAARVELSALRSRCTRSIEIDTCYATFHAMGIDHGPAYRGLTSVRVGESDDRRFVLARVELPACAAGTAGPYVLHPSVMDSVLQSAVGLLLTGPDAGAGLARPMLPFGLDRLEILQPCPAAAWVYLRPSAAHGSSPGTEGAGARSEASRGIDKVDIDVIDDAGAVCLRMIGFTSRVLPQELDGEHTLLLTPGWVDRPLRQSARSDVARTVLLDARYQARIAELASRWPAATWSVLAEPDTDADRMLALGEQVFSHVQSRLRAEPRRPALLQVILAAGADTSEISRGVGALLKTAAQEDPAFAGQVLALPAAASAAEIAQVTEDNARFSEPVDTEIRYVDGVRQALVWQTPASLRDRARAAAPWKDGGVYWITGGAGGLGRIFARAIAARTKGATIVLSGRSALDDAERAELAACAQNGARVEYRPVDVTDRRAVTEFVQALVRERGGLHGIVHGAGVIRDGFVVRKDVRELREVLAPKVLGTCHLDDATRELDLEFLLLFSSASAVLGNVGQADYAMANAFMDGYAARRDAWQRASGRSGRTLAINWPLWAEGGMRVSGALEAEMRRQGFDYLDTAAAMAALDRAWASGAAQVAVLAGDPGTLRQRVGLGAGLGEPHVFAAAPAGAEDRASPVAAPIAAVDAGDLQTRVQGALAAMIARDMKVAIEEIQPDHELTALGFDSVGFTVFSKALNGLYGLALRPTVFFEYPTLRGFAEHLVTHHGPQLAAKLAVPVAAGPAARVDAAPARRASPIEARAGRAAPSRAGVVSHARRPAASEDDPIAIVGMSGCFPGSDGVDAFWQNLAAERDCVVEVPASRWDWHAFYGDPTQETNKTNVKWGGFMAGVDEFDPLFFGIAPAEAELMDPAQRLLMTHTWKVIEDAGYSARSLSGTRTGIFVGTGTTGYTELIAQSGVPIEGHSATGAVASLGPNRMSYLLDLHGPSEPIETACSSSLVAIHRALRAMQSGDCEMALVGGVNVIPTPWAHISFSRAGMLCEDGRCKTFSKHANGYVRGEGVGMLFLKKLSAAERDGDHIYAVIRGSAENHGGRASSLTAPNPRAQAEVIQAAYREAGVDPRTVTYVETHGTGTALGDPIEIDGLKRAFGELLRDAAPAGEAYCGLGSVKTNIGHLELAAGVAGVIKVVMQLRHRTLVKSLHCDEINPYIDLGGSPFYLVRQTQAWNVPHDRDGRALPRRAGVSSFGFGGVNAHVVLEEYRGPQAPRAARRAVDRPAIIVLSAKNRERLREHAQQLLAHVTAHGGGHACTPDDLASIAYTLQVGREEMDHRLALVANDGDELRAKLAAYLEGAGGGDPDGVWSGQVRRDKDALAVFDADDDLQEAVARWLRKGKYSRLLALWVKGLAVDWHLLYGDAHPPRVPLPTYPFAKERYWIGRAEAVSAANAPVSAANAPVSAANAPVSAANAPVSAANAPVSAAQLPAAAPAPRWLKVAERWISAPLLAHAAPGNAVQRVLVLYRHDQDAAGIRRALADVWAGDAGDLQVDVLQLPDGPASAAQLPLDAYLAAHRAPDTVLWFSGAFADPARELAGVLLAIQTLRSRAAGQTLQFFYCYPHTGSEEQIHQEGLSGLFRAAALEWPSHGYCTLEYPAGGAPESYAAVAREWAGQATANPAFAQVSMVRYRGGDRQVTRLVELAGPEPVAAPVTLRRGGTYLMVGALGEVGRSVCLAFARSHAPRLVILSRRPDDAALRRQLQPIIDAGAQVVYRAVDVTDEERLAQTLAALKLEIGPIHGVFHLARAVDDGPLAAKRVEAFEQAIAAKVRGTLHVDKLTAGEPLDFFLAFSSMAAFGIEGSADYGYATAFQNAFVRDRNLRVARGQRAGRSLAVCWGQWRVDAYASAQRLAQVQRLGFDLIEASQAVPLIEAALRDRAEVVGIMAVHDARQVRQLYGLDAPLLELDPELDRARRALLEQTPEQLAALYASLTNGAGQESSWSQQG